MSATLGATHFTGSLRIPIPCLAACERQFDLSAASVNFGVLAASLRGEDEGVMQELLNRVRSRSQDWPLLDGTVHIARLALGQTRSRQRLRRSHPARWQPRSALRSMAARSAAPSTPPARSISPPRPATTQPCSSAASAPPELAQLLKEHWGPGTIDLSSDLAMSGTTASDLSGSAKGTLHWSWTGGALPQLTSTPLRRFDRWTGNGKVAKGAITITSSEVTSNSTTAMVTGTIGSDRSLDLKVAAPPKDSTQTPTRPQRRRIQHYRIQYNDDRHPRAPVVETQ